MYSPEQFIREWLGTPHVYNGRDASGVDCYGLVWFYYRDVMGVTLPDWHCMDLSRRWVVKFMQDKLVEYFNSIEVPKANCLVLARRSRIAHHIGVYFNGYVLHCPEGGSVVLQPLKYVEMLFGKLAYGVPNV